MYKYAITILILIIFYFICKCNFMKEHLKTVGGVRRLRAWRNGARQNYRMSHIQRIKHNHHVLPKNKTSHNIYENFIEKVGTGDDRQPYFDTTYHGFLNRVRISPNATEGQVRDNKYGRHFHTSEVTSRNVSDLYPSTTRNKSDLY